MARLWTTGFESQSPTLEFGVNSGVIVSGTTPTMSTTIKRRGTCAARFQPTAAQSYIEHQIDSGTVKRTFHRLYIRVAALPSANTNLYAIGQAGYFPASLRLNTDGTLLLRDSQSSTDLTGSIVLSLDRWYRVELDYTDVAGTVTAGVSAFKLYVDGALIADTLCSNINGWSRIRMGVSGVAATTDVYMDDVAVNDTAGSAQNGLPGPGAVVHLLPNAAGDNNLWETAVGGTAGAANNYTRVAERTPDDSTSYNQTAVAGTTTIDDFGLESAASAGIGTADQITCVQVGGRVSSDAFTAANMLYRLKSQTAGTVAESASIPVNNTGTAGAWSVHRGQSPRPYTLTSYTDPQDGSAWTAAKLDTAQIGYRSSVSQTTIRRVTSLWALVDFVPIFALGAATEENAASHLGYTQASIPLKNLVDDFADGTVDTALWPNSFGTISETGGRGRVALNTGYNAFSSAKAYTLENSQATFQIFPPGSMPEAGTTEAWAQVLIKSNVDGTDMGFEVQVTTGSLYCFNRTGFFDPESAVYTWNATNHAWLRIRETGGNVYFDAAPDGHTWTNLRTIVSPAWTADGDLEFQMIAHRADGADNFVEYDNVNVLFPQVVNLGVAASNNTARPIDANKSTANGAAASNNTATALTVIKTRTLGHADEDNTATALDPNKLRTLDDTAETNQGRPLHTVKLYALGLAAEESSATAVAHVRTAHLGAASEDNAATALDANKLRTLGAAAEEVDGKQQYPVRLIPNGVADEDNTARAVVAAKVFHLGVAQELTVAQAQPAHKLRVIGAAATESISQGLAASKRYAAAPADSQDAGGPTTARKTGLLGAASTATTAHALVWVFGYGVGAAADTSGGQPVTASKTHHLTPASAEVTANPITSSRIFHLGVAAESTQSRGVVPTKTAQLDGAATVEQGQGTEHFKRSGLGPAQAEATATALHVVKRRTLGTAGATSIGRPIEWVQAFSLVNAETTDTATLLVARKTRNLANGAAADVAGGVAVSKLRTVGLAHEQGMATSVAVSKTLVLGVAREVVEAGVTLESPKRRMLRTATLVEAAQPVHISRQRPADVLQPGVTGPSLTPGTSGPTLTVTATTGGS